MNSMNNLKSFLRLVLILLLCVLAHAVSGAVYWDNDSGDQRWDTQSNWADDAGPSTDSAIDMTGADESIVYSGVNADEAANVYVGHESGSTGSLVVSGGTLAVSGRIVPGYSGNGTVAINSGNIIADTTGIIIGWNPGSAGFLKVTGGAVSAQCANGIRCGYNGTGTITISGGQMTANKLTVPYNTSATGHVNLDGGTIHVTTSNFAMSTYGTMDIEEGVLVIDGDVKSTIDSYVSAGKITAFDGAGIVHVDYNESNAGKTTVRAVFFENDLYKVWEQSNYRINVVEKRSGKNVQFAPQLMVVYSAGSPGLSTGQILEESYNKGPSSLVHAVFSWNGDTAFTSAGTRVSHNANGQIYDPVNEKITWTFAAGSGYTVSAEVWLPQSDQEPKLTFFLNPSTLRYYSIGFTGTTGKDIADLDWIYQPLVWQGKRLPLKSYLTDESRCTLPAVMYSENGMVTGVCADPAQMSFRLPTMDNSKFGVTLRDASGNAKPSIFAPVFGGSGSLRGSAFSFSIRLLAREDDCYGSFKHMAENLFDFRDYRENHLCSLNHALDNLVDFIMNSSGNNYSYWSADYKSNEYVNDQPGYGRQQSAVDTLALAMVRDDQDLFDDRALPTIEYLASRKLNKCKLDGFDPAYPMGGPVLGIMGDWASLNRMTSGRCYAFEKFFELSTGDIGSIIDPSATYSREEVLYNTAYFLDSLLSGYQMTGNAEFLADAIKIADDYIYWRIDNKPVDFYDARTSFWSDIGPRWYHLEQLYNETGDPKYLDAAVAGLKELSAFINVSPKVTDGNITVNGETVPNWRVAEAGLTCEAAATSNSHRAIFMSFYAGALARLGYRANDSFLTHLGKAAMIGRYGNYPGYALRDNYSTKFEKETYPLQWYNTYSNTAHMNHPLPMACFMIDYLVSDVFARSKGNIMFPARYTATGAYFFNNVYGDRSGSFYGEDNVWLWLPKALITTDSIQVNYIAGYNPNDDILYLALTNQSDSSLSNVTVTLNSSLIPYSASNNARVWKENVQGPDITVFNGAVDVDIAAGGITVLAINNMDVQTRFQRKYIDTVSCPLTEQSYVKTSEIFGNMTGMIISIAPALTNAFVYTDADPYDTNSVTLYYKIDDGSWQNTIKAKYPYEFSIPLSENNTQFQFYLVDDASNSSSTQTLRMEAFDTENLSPEDGAVNVYIDTSLIWTAGVNANSFDIYLGTGYEAVSGATRFLPEYKGTVSTTLFTPDTLDVNTTYYWRIDKVNGNHTGLSDLNGDRLVDMSDFELLALQWQWPGGTGTSDLTELASHWLDFEQISKGSVWSFTTEASPSTPTLIAPAGLTATASDNYTGRDAVYALNGAGMTGEAHTSGNPTYTMWMGAGSAPPKWFKIDLGSSYSNLDFMKIYNFNWSGYTSRGCRNVQLFYSNSSSDPGNPVNNPGNWTSLGSAFDLTKAPGASDYGTTNMITPDEVALYGITARWLSLKINSDWGGGYCGLSEVRVYGHQ